MADMEDSDRAQEPAEEPSGSPAWRKRLVLIVLLVVVASVIARVTMAADDPATDARASGGGTSALVQNNLVEGGTGTGGGSQDTTAAKEEPGTLGKLLPFITEGGVAMLLGIALGVATRAVFKIALIGIAVVFVAVQFMAYKGWVEIDWTAVESGFRSLKDYVFNISAEHDLGQIVTYKLPSAGSFGLGYLLGLKRG